MTEPREGRGLSQARRTNTVEEPFDVGVGGFMPSHKVGMKHWIRKFQKGTETVFIVLGKALIDVFDEADQQRIKLPHTASTTPSEPRSLCVQRLVAPGRDQLLYFSDRLGGIEVLRARLSAV